MYQFGNWLTRALRGGVILCPAEQWLLAQLVAALPEHLASTAHAQLRSYNLAQREIDGRAVNLYRRPDLSRQMPVLPMSVAEAPMVRITIGVVSDEPVHATLHAVSGRVFCMALSRSVQGIPVSALCVLQVTHAWRSNFPECAPRNPITPAPFGPARLRR